MNTYYNVAVA